MAFKFDVKKNPSIFSFTFYEVLFNLVDVDDNQVKYNSSRI